MKQSRYNFNFEYKGNKYIYNSLSGAFAKTDDEYDEILAKIEADDNFEDNDNKTFIQMLNSGIIIKNEFNEIEKYKELLELYKHDSSTCQFTIAPTLKCNCRCYYCYESKNDYKMSKDNLRRLIDFLKGSIKNAKNCLITWYGGEPLLCQDIIYEVSKEIISFCDKNNIYYEASMITNATLITDEVLDSLIKYRVKTVQITLDGCKEQHNKKRIFVNGKGTYDLILNNIKKVDKKGIKISIRINTDKETGNGIDELINDLKKLKLKNSTIYFGLLGTPTEVCSSISGTCCSNHEFALNNLEWFKKIKDAGLVTSLLKYYPSRMIIPCRALSYNSCVIDSKGNLYKCFDDIGVESTVIGNLINTPSLPLNENNNLTRYTKWDPTNIKDCLECKFLPICGGFCPFFSMKGEGLPCIKWKYILIDYLKRIIDTNSKLKMKGGE